VLHRVLRPARHLARRRLRERRGDRRERLHAAGARGVPLNQFGE
jgi:hypothetical protein